MDLSHILNQYNEDHYSVLKNFEIFEGENTKSKRMELEFDSRFEGGNLFCAFKNKN